mgnify:CR=1 FL=1
MNNMERMRENEKRLTYEQAKEVDNIVKKFINNNLDTVHYVDYNDRCKILDIVTKSIQ